MDEQSASGMGHLRSGQRDLGVAHYEIHVGLRDRRETVVELESPPVAQNGEILELIRENGQVLQIRVSGDSPYCRVIGGRLARERRVDPDAPVSAHMEHGRRRSDARQAMAIQHPCPRCLANEVVVTHRGIMLTTLFCTACRHGWGESPSVVAAATHMDRRTLTRAESAERRSPDRLQPPSCTYCDAHVRSIRRTADEVYFACDGCEAMWSLPRPKPHNRPRASESR